MTTCMKTSAYFSCFNTRLLQVSLITVFCTFKSRIKTLFFSKGSNRHRRSHVVGEPPIFASCHMPIRIQLKLSSGFDYYMESSHGLADYSSDTGEKRENFSLQNGCNNL